MSSAQSRQWRMASTSGRLASVKTTWSVPPATPHLAKNDVHVWRASVAQSMHHMRHLRETLSVEERERADRFRFAEHRDQYMVARGLLRLLLSQYLGREPDELKFDTTPYGKPVLMPHDGGDALHFNLSHSSGVVLFAISRDRDVGIDIEALHRDVAYEGIAEVVFSSREAAMIRDLRGTIRRDAFFTCWTCREAYVKARGQGLSRGLSQIDVVVDLRETASVLKIDDEDRDPSVWLIERFDPGPGFVGALAVGGSGSQQRYWQFESAMMSSCSRRPESAGSVR